MYLNVPQVNEFIYSDSGASDNISQGALFLAAFEAKASPSYWERFFLLPNQYLR